MALLTKLKGLEFFAHELEALAEEAGVAIENAVLSLVDNDNGTHSYHVDAPASASAAPAAPAPEPAAEPAPAPAATEEAAAQPSA